MIQKSRLIHSTALALFVEFAMAATLAAQTPVQIHPDAGSPAGPVVIAVLADNFASNQQEEFNEAAANLILHALLADSYFADNKAKFVVKTIFNPSSDLGFDLDPGSTRCSIKWDEAQTPSGTDARILQAGSAVSPFRTIVIGNYGYNFGCMAGLWAYVTVGATGHPVLEHEFGHLLGDLLDEYVDRGNEQKQHPSVEPYKNCAPGGRTPPWWGTLNVSSLPNTAPAGCDHFGLGVVRPTDHCRMRSFHDTFCEVCRSLLTDGINAFEEERAVVATLSIRPSPAFSSVRVSTAGFSAQPSQPAQPSQSATQSVHVLLRMAAPKPGAAAITPTVISATNATGPVILRTRRVGDYVFEVSEAGKTLAVGVITGNPFETRQYRGGGAAHERSTSDSGNIVVIIPGETLQRLVAPTRAVQIAVYPLPPNVGRDVRIDRIWLDERKAQKQALPVAQLPAQTLKDRLTEILRTTK